MRSRSLEQADDRVASPTKPQFALKLADLGPQLRYCFGFGRRSDLRRFGCCVFCSW
jgi:hypothetical protein